MYSEILGHSPNLLVFDGEDDPSRMTNENEGQQDEAEPAHDSVHDDDVVGCLEIGALHSKLRLSSELVDTRGNIQKARKAEKGTTLHNKLQR